MRHRLGCRAASLFITTVRDSLACAFRTVSPNLKQQKEFVHAACRRRPGRYHQAQSVQTPAFDDGDGAAAYAEPATQEFAAERTGRLRRDR